MIRSVHLCFVQLYLTYLVRYSLDEFVNAFYTFQAQEVCVSFQYDQAQT